MPKFSDSYGKEWNLKLTVSGIKRVKYRCDVDLTNFNDASSFKKLNDDLFLIVATVAELLKPQIHEEGLKIEEFEDRITANELASMVDALLEAMVEFYPNPYRTLLQRSLQVHREQSPKLTAKLMEIIDQEGEKLYGKPSINSQE